MLAVVLLASALKLLEVSNQATAWILGGATATATACWYVLRRGRSRPEEQATAAPAPASRPG
ncbi:hypothetical protein [Nonomuraea salmonea]